MRRREAALGPSCRRALNSAALVPEGPALPRLWAQKEKNSSPFRIKVELK